MTLVQAAAEIATRFAVSGAVASVEAFDRGHIHDSFVVRCEAAVGGRRYLLQRINQRVFPRPEWVIENIVRVTGHLRGKLRSRGVTDLERRVLSVIPALGGPLAVVDGSGETWRMYAYVEGTRVVPAVASPREAYLAGRAFGDFQSMLADLPPPRLQETIPGFHDTRKRYEALLQAVRADEVGRAREAEPEIDFARQRGGDAGEPLVWDPAGELPERVVHNDAKLDNVLLDAATGETLCVVDLDTVMPGIGLCDFGDMVRAMSHRAAEDEADLERVQVAPQLFEGLAAGYLAGMGEALTAGERATLVRAAWLITLEQGMRFLTDYLAGDRYYKTQRPRHNLERCRVQFRLLTELERLEPELRRIVAGL